jgi:hypothetical protein
MLKRICLIQFQLDKHYILHFFLDNVSSTCFGCYLQPSSGTQLQRTAIGLYGLVICSNGITHQTIQNLWLYAAVVLLIMVANRTRNIYS